MKESSEVEQGQGERMIPLSAVEPILRRVRQLIAYDANPDSRLLLHYDDVAEHLGLPRARDLISP